MAKLRTSTIYGSMTINNDLFVRRYITTASFTGLTQFLDTTDSTTKDNGSVVFEGGIGIERNVNIGGVLRVADTTASTTKDTGSVVLEGGMGVEGSVNVGGSLGVVGVITNSNTTSSTNKDTGALVLQGGMGVEENVNIGGVLRVANTTTSTTKDTGSVIFEGGVGIEENLNIGGVFKVASTTTSTSKDSGAVVIEGGVGIEENLYTGGLARFVNGTASSSTSTGAVVIGTGGLGVGGYIYASRVYGAVWNDIADFIEVEPDCLVISGKAYGYSKGKHYICTDIADKHSIGICSDTYGFSVGTKEGIKQLPLAIGGFVLAYCDKIYDSGTPLVSSHNGYLTKAPLLVSLFHPERIMATFYKEEKKEIWYKVSVNNRHWVKVR